MKRYSEERKAAVLGNCYRRDVTLYVWRKQVRAEGMAVPGAGKVPDNWSAEAKLAVVIETAGLSEINLGAYCRQKGVYVEQVKVRISNASRSWSANCGIADAQKKSRGDLGMGRGRLINTPDRREMIELIEEAGQAGARKARACEVWG